MAGFNVNPLDPCVFNMIYKSEQVTVCLYVDDILITCVSQATIDMVIEHLRNTYKTLEVGTGSIHSYLGMTLNFSTPGQVAVTMEHYLSEMLQLYDVNGTAATPATEYLFEIRDSPPLNDRDREEFHSRVAKILYLAKRTRPDVLTACVFLAKRVQSPTEDDWQKLERVLKYLNGSREFGIILSAKPGMIEEEAYIDAAYGVHADAKSHTGTVITLGQGPIFVKSSGQKLVSKSSTEAELIAMSDSLSNVIWLRQFLQYQGYNMGPAIVYQDNKSTMALANKGRSTSERTRHINIRHFFVKDRIDSGDIVIQYKPTGEMIADILTKPLQGALFRRLRALLLNWNLE